MDQHSTTQKFGGAGGNMAPDGSNPWKWICLGLGLAVIILPSIQNLLVVMPLLDMLDFIPLSYFITEMAPIMLLANANIIAYILLFIGGVLLILGKRGGYILVVSSSAFLLISIVETVVILVLAAAASGGSTGSLYFSEMFSVMGIFPVFVFILEIIAIILLNFKEARNYLKADGIAFRTMATIAIILFLDLNFCLLVTYLQSR
jgi:hypothetical protein